MYSYDPYGAGYGVVADVAAGSGQPFALRGGLLCGNGMLYGNSLFGGTYDNRGCRGGGCDTVFTVDIATATIVVLHSLGAKRDGSEPNGGLIEDQGLIYGTTRDRGSRGAGTIFSVDPTTGTATVVSAFRKDRDGHDPTMLTRRGHVVCGVAQRGRNLMRNGSLFSFRL